MKKRTLTIEDLAPYLQAEISAAASALPSRLAWPISNSVRVDDYSDGSIGAFYGSVSVDGATWILQGRGDGRSPVDAIPTAWNLRVDRETGDVWAVPACEPTLVDSGPGTFEDLLKAVDIGPRRIATLGMLVPLYDPDNVAAVALANELGMNPAMFRLVRVSDLDRIHATLTQAARL